MEWKGKRLASRGLRGHTAREMRRQFSICGLTALLLFCAGGAAFPLVWMMARSFRGLGEAQDSWTLGNYIRLFSQTEASAWLANSLFLVGMQTLVACFSCTLAGYVLAHHRFWGRRMLLVMLVATVLLPGQVTFPATWRLLRDLGLLNSYAALVIPAAGSALGALLFYQAAKQIPGELLDAARMDGCSERQVWWLIVIPAVQPTLVTFAILSFTANWNAYLWPQIILQDESKSTLAMGLANLATMPQQRDLGLMLAATTLSILPAFALFLAARGSLEESLTEGVGK